MALDFALRPRAGLRRALLNMPGGRGAQLAVAGAALRSRVACRPRERVGDASSADDRRA
jgi:hypothetical protein